jgi:general stress protein 26
MRADTVRTGPERKAHALAKLQARYAEAWVASASTSGNPHMVPLSVTWDGRTIILSAGHRSLTVRNIVATGKARLALGETGDVVMIDARLEESVPLADARPELAQAFADQADWDPRHARDLPGASDGDYVYLRLLPERVQVWRHEREHAGRTVMRAGRWVT